MEPLGYKIFLHILDMLGELALSAAMSVFPPEHEAQLKSLQKRLSREGYDISAYVKDERFEIYEPGKASRAVNYADTARTPYMKHETIEKSADFAEENTYWLYKAEKEFGTPPEIITALLQLETQCGKYLGNYPVLNSLITIYLRNQARNPERAGEYYGHLKAFLKLHADTTDGVVLPDDIFDVKGSWAGAFGIQQFMPYNVPIYGTDFDGDGFFDPFSAPDAIGACARYLTRNGFGKNQKKGVQSYNPRDSYYGSSVLKHADRLKAVMKERARRPPPKVEPLIPDEWDIAPELPEPSLRPMRLQQATQETAYRNDPGNKPKRGFLGRAFTRKAHR
jgi:membrane-bound lytic murein transglycosylase B